MNVHPLGVVAGLLITALGSVWVLRSPLPLAPASPVEADRPPVTQSLEPIHPIERDASLDPRKVALGARLFRDPRLSHDDSVACASCHDLEHGGADHGARSRGVHGALGARNAPTVYNSGLNPAQFWDGRASSLEEQIDGPLTAPNEMASTWPEVLPKLAADAGYARDFAAAYPGELAAGAVKDAIASFERSLTTMGSRFDRFLAGDAAALTRDEAEGYRLFKSYGCASCHQGANVGGNLFERFGVLRDYFADHAERPEDLGRYNVTKRDEDRYKFRVPSLRLAVRTAPYLHDGSVATLKEAVELMARYQLGRELAAGDAELLIQFLGALPGEEAP